VHHAEICGVCRAVCGRKPDNTLTPEQRDRVIATAIDHDAAFDGLGLDRLRTIVTALLTITVNPVGKGRAFDRRNIDVLFR
jgi:hypothetical protein